MSNELHAATRYRQYAEELRTIAADYESRPNRDALLKLAKNYEQMANTMDAIDTTNKALERAKSRA